MSVDVIIVGAGPVGLMLAIQLQRRGIRYRLLESRPGRDYWCKALGVSPRTLEIFDQMGILGEALARGLFFTARNTLVGDKIVDRAEVDPERYPYNAMAMGQFDTEEILESELRRAGGQIEWSSLVTRMERNFSGVEVEWSAPGQTCQAQCRYLVGCDGAHSFVRKSLGLAFEGEKFEQPFFLGDVELDWDRSHTEVWKLVQVNDQGKLTNVVMVVPIPGNPRRYRISTTLPRELAENPLEPLEMLRQVCMPVLPAGSSIDNLRWASHYSISHRLVERYRERNCFLAGDAAHIHPPIGGLGMNTGLQDAFNLGWKLAAVLRGEALETLLETYQVERHKVGQEVVELTAGRMRDQGNLKPPDESAEERANTQLFVHYRGSILAQGSVPEGQSGAAPGDRLDTIGGLRCRFLAAPFRLIEFLRHGEFQLIGFGGDWEGLVGLVEHLGNAFGNQLHCLAIANPDGPQPPETLLCLQDPNYQIRRIWGPGPGAILVRPDGYVGWRGLPRRDEPLDRFLAQVSLNLQP